MEDYDLISVIIPTFSRPTYLRNAVMSVLSQTWENIEVIVVDDNGVGTNYGLETERVMSEFSRDSRVKYIQHLQNKNGSAARNTGIKNARGKFVAFLDDDDVFHETKIARQHSELKAKQKGNSRITGCYCGYRTILKGRVQRCYSYSDEGNLLKQLLLNENSICAGSTLLVEKKAVDDIGGFDETFSRLQDWEFLVRFFRENELAVVEECLVDLTMDGRTQNYSATFADKVLSSKSKFLETFRGDIEKMPQRDLIYKKQNMNTLEVLLYCHQYRKAKGYIVSLYKQMSIKEYCRLCFLFLDSVLHVKQLVFHVSFCASRIFHKRD